MAFSNSSNSRAVISKIKAAAAVALGEAGKEIVEHIRSTLSAPDPADPHGGSTADGTPNERTGRLKEGIAHAVEQTGQSVTLTISSSRPQDPTSERDPFFHEDQSSNVPADLEFGHAFPAGSKIINVSPLPYMGPSMPVAAEITRRKLATALSTSSLH